MEITLNIPDDLARQVTREGRDPARVALEALALEGYRAELLSESAVRQMLGFDTRMEVHAFLKEHGVHLHYDLADLEQDRATAQKVREKILNEGPLGKHLPGMIVVADTSPINYLILIEEIDVLAKLYRRAVIPPAVRDELLRPSAPAIVRRWIGEIPSWLEVHAPANPPDASLAALDPGERDAILLAAEFRADQLIVDDRQGRRAAESRGIPVMGTLGVLREAAALGLLNLPLAVERLKRTSFYIAPEILACLIRDVP